MLKNLLYLALVLFIFSCQEDKVPASNPSSFKSLISYHTGKNTSIASPIIIQLVDSVASMPTKDLFEISPSVNGKIKWINSNRISFIPDENLTYNKEYVGQLNLGNLYSNLPDSLKTYTFHFSTKTQYFDIYDQHLIPVNDSVYTLNGKIRLNDVIDISLIEKNLSVKLNSENLKPSIHKISKTKYEYTVTNFARKIDAQQISTTLYIDEKSINYSTSNDTKIPALGDFNATDYELINGNQQLIKLYFSDQLNLNQSFEGLVHSDRGNFELSASDNQISLLFDEQISGQVKITIEKGILNNKGYKTQTKKVHSINLKPQLPEVKLITEKTIIPFAKQIPIQFKTVNLKAVDVHIYKVFQNNINHFLQPNDIDESSDLYYLGEMVSSERVDFDEKENLTIWQKHTLDLSNYVKKDPTALYHIKIGFRRSYSLYPCENEYNEHYDPSTLGNGTTPKQTVKNFWQIHDMPSDNWDYDEINNPCHPMYYTRHYNHSLKISTNVLASNIGIITKEQPDGKLFISTNSIKNTQPLKGVKIELYNLENRLIKTIYTQEDGSITTKTNGQIHLVHASLGKQRGYLKLTGHSKLSLSKFDVDGINNNSEVQGLMYTERGVWRPGDSIYVNLILDDKGNNLPKGFPIGFEFINPKGQTIQRVAKSTNVNQHYTFHTKTTIDAPTGNYTVKAFVGNQTFTKNIKIETVRPNRLKIDFNITEKQLSVDSSFNTKIKVDWMHGAKGKGLKTTIKASISSKYTSFKGYENYIFTAPYRSFEGFERKIIDVKTDDNGQINQSTKISSIKKAPGKLNVKFNIKVFEKGGRFSVESAQKTLHPYNHYLGLDEAVGDRWGDFRIDRSYDFNLVNLSKNGKLADDKLKVKIYKIDWNWWYEMGSNDDYVYKGKVNKTPIKSDTITTKDGMATYKLLISQEGRYFVVFENSEGHTTGQTLNFYKYSGESRYVTTEENKGTQKLELTADKKKYEVGEYVKLKFPTPSKGRALITIEDGQKILIKKWINTTNTTTSFRFKTTSKMSPACYANVIYIQPHQNTKNNLPIRLYSVIPINIEWKNSHLSPIISMKDEVEPKENYTIKINEKKGLPMTYTIAIVDQGLLDLTHHQNPDVWKHFNNKSSLEINTYDIYDDVIKAQKYNSKSLLSLGGDGSNKPKDGAKINRFKPVVKFLGPFYLPANSKKYHRLKMDNYIGEVRVSVIAAHNHAFGQAEKQVKVKSPLMVLGSLPRVLGPNETCYLPVDIFTMDSTISDVKIYIESNDLLTIKENYQEVQLKKGSNNKTAFFELKTLGNLGHGKVKIEAIAGNHKATYQIDLNIRASATNRYKTYSQVLAPNTVFNQNLEPYGYDGTNFYTIELSSIPPINLKKRLEYLIHYPYGCVEQTTSSVFPQLFLNSVMKLNTAQKRRIERNINKGIERLQLFQTPNGGLAYWPGQNSSHEWGSNYAGHFLLEAKRIGFVVNPEFLDNWISFQTNLSEQWNVEMDKGTLTQAYRLYLLAKAGSPNIGAMNRLRVVVDSKDLSSWYLAAAYKLIGKPSISESLIENTPTSVLSCSEEGETFGSDKRDLAIILQMLCELDQHEQAMLVAKQVANNLNSKAWMSTQTTAYSLLGIASYIQSNQLDDNAHFKIGNTQHSVEKSIWQKEFVLNQAEQQTIENHSNTPLYLTITQKGIPNSKDTLKESHGIQLSVVYKNLNGKIIPPEDIQQGEDFTVEMKVKNNLNSKLMRMSLTHIFPSGWEINNSRMNGSLKWNNRVNYEDIRDDRINLFYNISAHETKTFKYSLNASFIGAYYLPAVQTEAMYNHAIRSRVPGKWVKIIKEE